MTDPHPQTGFTELSPDLALEILNAALEALASAFLTLECHCVAQRGTV